VLGPGDLLAHRQQRRILVVGRGALLTGIACPQSERMGLEVPGMRGVYSRITPRIRAVLTAGLRS
jgi:hypothetical protein